MSIYIGPQNSVNQGKIVLKKIEDGLALDREHIEFTTRGLLLHVAHLESELARLRKAIEAVIDMCPHDDTCPNHKLGRSGWAQRACCTCSKRAALEGK